MALTSVCPAPTQTQIIAILVLRAITALILLCCPSPAHPGATRTHKARLNAKSARQALSAYLALL